LNQHPIFAGTDELMQASSYLFRHEEVIT